ncbi:MAG TPA: aquaporin [Anaerolineales bacterium]|nr:aquaporin [Anaerolineales bacterium]
MFNSRVFVAELIGTFALVFIGAGAGVVGAGLLGVALAHGLTLAVFVYVYGHISGTHVNPAVTFGLALNGTIRWAEAVVYWIAQFAGAAIAGFLLLTITRAVNAGDFSTGELFAASTTTHGVLTTDFPGYAFGVELLLTFLLVNTVLHAAVAGRAGSFAGLAVGLTLTIAILAGGPMTGAALNPARTLGPALFTGDLAKPTTYLIYLAGPIIGSALAVGLFKFLNGGDTTQEPVKRPPKKK